MRKFFLFLSSLVISLILVVASVVPAGATNLGVIINSPSASTNKTYAEVFNGQQKNFVCAISSRYTNPLNENQYYNQLRLIQVTNDSDNTIYKKSLVRFPHSGGMHYLYLFLIQSKDCFRYSSSVISGIRYYETIGKSYSKVVNYGTPWSDVRVPDPSSYNSYHRFYEFDIFGYNVCMIYVGNFSNDLQFDYSIQSNGKYAGSNDSQINEILNNIPDDVILAAGIGEGVADIIEPDGYDPTSDPDSPEFSWTDENGSTFYGKDNPNYKWTDENGSTYPEVSSDFGDDFGVIRGYISEIGSFNSVLSENYESQSELCSYARLQIDSVMDSIPIPIFTGLGLLLLVIVACKILQR